MTFSLQDVSVAFDSIPALDGISCRIESGAAVLLTGATGAGKTTFLSLLYARQLPTHGSVQIDGVDSKAMKGRTLRATRQKIGVIFQDAKLISSLSAYENAIAPLIIAGFSKRASDKRCLEILADLGISYLRDKMPDQLSGGERQLVALARAIMNRPDCILADEPSAQLDGSVVDLITRTLLREHARGATLLVATHDPLLMKAFAGTERLNLVDGRISTIDVLNASATASRSEIRFSAQSDISIKG